MVLFNLFKSRKLSIGDAYKGGKIAYIDTSGSHGLIAANTDQSIGIQWNTNLESIGAQGEAIGTGLSNTDKVLKSTGVTEVIYAAEIARSYNGGGYFDWHLPSKEELNQLYLNKSLIGGFHNFFYWSSTEFDKNSAWIQFFSNGVKFSCLKSGTYYVRAVRRF